MTGVIRSARRKRLLAGLWAAAPILLILGLVIIVNASFASDSAEETQRLADSLSAQAVTGESEFRMQVRESRLIGGAITAGGIGLLTSAIYLTWFRNNYSTRKS